MLSQKALARLRTEKITAGSCLEYVLNCFKESLFNILRFRKLAVSITRSILIFWCLSTVGIVSAVYGFESGEWVFYTVINSLSSVAVLFFALMHISLMRDAAGIVNKTLGVPNMLSLSRLLLIAPVVIFLHQDRIAPAIICYIAGAATDIIDGAAARARNEITRFGVMVDPAADVTATASIFILLTYKHVIPGWVLFILLLRYIHLVVGSVLIFFAAGPINFRATAAGKIVGILQASAVIIILLSMLGGGLLLSAIGKVLFPALGMGFFMVIVLQTLIGWKLLKTKAG